MPIKHYEIAQRAVRSAILSWGRAWTRIDPQSREAAIMLAIVQYLSGHTRPYFEEGAAEADEWKQVLERPWTAKDCMDVLRTCQHWCSKQDKYGMYGPEIIRFAHRDKDDLNDPINQLEAHFRYAYG